MTRKRLVPLGFIAVCLTVGILVGTHASAGRKVSKTAHKTIRSDQQSRFELKPMPPQDGALLIQAKLWLGHAPVPYPPNLWWYVEVRRGDDNDKFTPFWQWEYKDQQFVHDFQSEHSWGFVERIAVPAGVYHVHISVRDDWPYQGADGKITRGRDFIGESQNFVVN
jgi:hypothetical protein